MRARLTRCAGALACVLSVVASRPAHANPEQVVLLPAVSPAEDGSGALRRPAGDRNARLAELARQLDWILGEAAQDLGLTLDVSDRNRVKTEHLSEAALVARAHDSWLVSPRIELDGRTVKLRLVAIAPGSQVVMTRTGEMTVREMEVGAMVMMRDLVVAGRGAVDDGSEVAPLPPSVQRAAVRPADSEGRAVLALNGAVLGGYIGLSLQRASGSDDVRLTYPLIALGTGVGLGSSMIVASEWDIGVGDAWYLSAGMWWPTASGLLLAQSYDVQPIEDRYVYGLIGASSGMTLATVALSFQGISQGGATLAHSGGAWGTVLGGLTQVFFEGSTEAPPTRGMGFGAGAGVLAAGVLATQVDVMPSRVLIIDLLAALGGLTGAAIASPLVFGEDTSKVENRAWLASIVGATFAGAGIGLGLTANSADPPEAAMRWAALPYAGVIKASPSADEPPALGGGVRGFW